MFAGDHHCRPGTAAGSSGSHLGTKGINRPAERLTGRCIVSGSGSPQRSSISTTLLVRLVGYGCKVATQRRLYRSRTHRFVAGVCGGIAEFFGLNPTLVRIGFVFFGLFGVGELVYLLLWLIVPKQPH